MIKWIVCEQVHGTLSSSLYHSGLVKFVDQLISEGVIVAQGSGGGAPSHAPTTTASSEEDAIQRGGWG